MTSFLMYVHARHISGGGKGFCGVKDEGFGGGRHV